MTQTDLDRAVFLPGLRRARGGVPRSLTSAVGHGQLLAAALIWGSIGLFVRGVDAPAITITFYRVLFAAVSLLVLLNRRAWQEYAQLRGREVLQLLAVAAFYSVNWVLLFAAVQVTTVGQATLAYYTAPAFMALFALLFLKERLSGPMMASIGLGFLGLLVILDAAGDDGGSFRGILLGCAGGIAYAAAVTTARPLSRRLSPLSLALGQTGGGTVLLLPVALVLGIAPPTIDATGWAALVMLGLVHTTVAFALFFGGLRSVPAARTGLLMYLDPVSSVLLAGIFLGERLGATTLVGGALIIAAGVLGLVPASMVRGRGLRLRKHPVEG